MTERETVLVIDANNIAMRAIHAARSGQVRLSNNAGIPTAALLISINMISKYVKEVSPDRVSVCWDGGSFRRKAIWDGYKANRKSAPDDEQDRDSTFALTKEFLSLANVHHVQVAGFEADDIIAHYWRVLVRMTMVILSGDKDLLQLLSPDCTQIRPGSDDETWTVERFVEEQGIEPRYWGHVLALAGDTSDGIDGVPRVGYITASKMLAEYDYNIEKLLTVGHPKLDGHVDTVRRNLRLVDLRTHGILGAGLGLDLPEPPPFAPTDPDSALWQGFMDFLERFEMNSVRSRLLDGTLWRTDGASRRVQV